MVNSPNSKIWREVFNSQGPVPTDRQHSQTIVQLIVQTTVLLITPRRLSNCLFTEQSKDPRLQTVNPLTLYTLYPLPFTLYPIPYTLYPIRFTLYPIPYTLYPIPYTLNSKQSIGNRPSPLMSEKGTTEKFQRHLPEKRLMSRPEFDLDCLLCAILSRQLPEATNRDRIETRAVTERESSLFSTFWSEST